jgi:N-alpha-acetyl-L-2,4-diaminobutyrate deacetylase
MDAFNAPYSVQLLEIDSVGMYDTAIEDMGKVLVSTELGGGGSATAKSIAIAKKGLRNVLIHAGIMHGEMQIDPTIRLDMPDSDCFVFSEGDGLFEPMIDLGEDVQKGQTVARIWPVDRTGIMPVELTAKISGMLISRHFPGLIKSGDCAVVIGLKTT